MKTTWLLNLTTTTVLLVCMAFSPPLVSGAPGRPRLAVDMTVVQNAGSQGAFCLDGSLPAYNLHKGSGEGADNWLLQFEGGGWCESIKSCMERSKTRRGSTNLMTKTLIFSGILSNDPTLNPDFHNWNRLRLRYCDGASFAGDTEIRNGASVLHFRGQRILKAIINDLLPKGLSKARNVLLTGVSAGGLSTFLHCDNFTSYLPKTANVKCMSDAGFFIDATDVSSNRRTRAFYKQLVAVQGVEPSLDPNCKKEFSTEPFLCYFPQNIVKYIKTPFFILDSAYDVHQFRNGLVPPSADKTGAWAKCKANIGACNPQQLEALQGFRKEMLTALTGFYRTSPKGGMFINSCFAHGQSSLDEAWLSPNSPRIDNKTIAATVGDWYFGRGKEPKEIGYPYPCDKTCVNLIPAPTTQSLPPTCSGPKLVL